MFVSRPPGLLFLVVYFGLLVLLLSPVTPMSVVTYMQASNMPAIIIGRVGEDNTSQIHFFHIIFDGSEKY